ncbi:unnamed protein product [Laminaria digitata]
MDLIKFYFLDGDAEDIFTGFFRILGAILFTHLAASVLHQGNRTVRSATYYQENIKVMTMLSDTSNGPERSQLFYLGLGASLREGLASYLFMVPLGGAYSAEDVPLPAVLGAIAGLLAARHLAPALIWGGIGENDQIRADSRATSWAVRREALTNQYVSRLAAQATGKAALNSDADDVESKQSSTGHPGAQVVTKNLSQLSAGALQEMFRDSKVDPEHFEDMDYDQKRLLVLKSSKALRSDHLDDTDSDDDDYEPAILALQNSSEWGSVSSFVDGGSISGGVGGRAGRRAPGLVSGEPSGSGQSALFNHRKGQSLVSIAEDADGYIDRGGYSAEVPVHQRYRSAMKGSGGLPRDTSLAEGSVRFQDNHSDDGRSVMDSFQHRYLQQAGSRDPRAELEVMEAALSHSVVQKRSRDSTRSLMNLRPGSPQGRAPAVPAPSTGHDLDESIGGNMDLGVSKKSKRSSTRSMRWGLRGSARNSMGSMSGKKAGLETADGDDEDDFEAARFGGRNVIPDDEADKTFLATIALSISAFVIFLCCAGLFKLGVLDFKNVFDPPDDDEDNGTQVYDICGCCEANQDGSVSEAFFAIFQDQFGYTCLETFTGLIAWVVYWVYPFLVMLFTMRAMCFSAIPAKAQAQLLAAPERRTAAQAQAAASGGFSMKSTKRFLGGEVPDPARIKHHPTHFWIKLSAVLNIGAGIAYIWWRAARSMPDNPKSALWNWLFFTGECILMVGVWTSHLQRAFPSIRDLCTMDDLVEIDSSVANEAKVCIMVPTAGEKMKNLKHVLLGAYSQRLWPTTLYACNQLRIAVLDEKGRHEVRELVEKVYGLAEVLVIPSVQLELCTKFGEPFITPKIFMDYFNQMDALDQFVFGDACHPAFDYALRIENYTGVKSNKLARGSSSTGLPKAKKKKAKGPSMRLEEGFKQLFNSSRTIPSMIYSARASPGTPKVSPKAGNMNAAIFRNSPEEDPVIGKDCTIVVVNDARHRLKTEFLQRTVPYFFKLNRRTGKNYGWADVGFVQTPQRFEDVKDGDPLGNHAVLTFFVSNVSKDGVGGVTSCGQGSLWRVDALRGMAADGTQDVDSDKAPDIIGHDCGFRSEVLIEDTHTSLEFFKKQWRSAYVCEPGETLAVCVEQPNTVAWRVKQVFRWHIGAVQLLVKDGPCFVCTSKMPTVLHKMFGLDSLTYYIQAVGGFFIILMPIMFSIFQETPFDTQDLEFIYFFFPYIITATIPTILAVGWKNVNPNRVLTDEQFWLSTCYVQIWAFALGIWNRITCANPDNAWNLVCPVWPLGLLFCLLIVSAINTTIYWAFYLEFDQSGIWIFLASFGACLVVMYSIWPMVKLWWPGWVGLPSAYHQKFCYILIFIALTSVLATFIET